MARLDFDYSLHDAYIESVTIGPRGEIHLALALGSARISDERLPDEATLRIGAIENFVQVREFFDRLGPEPIARIDRVTVLKQAGSSSIVALEIDPHGIVEIVCSRLELLPPATAQPDVAH